MILTTILITCFVALAGVMQAPMVSTLLHVAVLSLPSLSTMFNILSISSPVLVPTLPRPAVFEPYSELLLQVTSPYNLPSKALGIAPSTPATYSPTPSNDAHDPSHSTVSLVLILLFLLPISAVFAAIIYTAITCKPSLASVSRIQDQLLALLENLAIPPMMIITDYQGLAQSIGYPLPLDKSPLLAYDDIDSMDSSASGSLAASTSLYDSLFAPVTSDSVFMPLNDPAPLSQQINEDALACIAGWSVISTGLDNTHEVECLETGDRYTIYPVHEEFEEWANPFRDDG